MRRAAIVLALLVLAMSAFGKRTSDYIPPPQGLRVLRGFLGLSILAIPVYAAAAIAGRRSHRTARAMSIVAAFVFIGAMIAAGDALNDELWNPAFYGAWFVAAALPVALALVMPKGDRYRTSAVVLGILIAFPLGLVLASYGGMALMWIWLETGLPTTW